MKKYKLLSVLLSMGIILLLAMMPRVQANSEIIPSHPEGTFFSGDKYFFFETFTNINGVGDVGGGMLIDFPTYVIRSNPFQVESRIDLKLTENTVAVIADGVSRTGTAGGGISSGLFTSDGFSGKGGDYEWKAESDGTLNFKYGDQWIKLAVGETFLDTKDITPKGRTGTMTQKFTVKNYGFIDKSCVITPNRPTKTPVGDLNGDSQINAIDLGVMTKYLLGKISEIPADDDLWAADLNGDNVINAIDCAYLRKYLLGMISHFPKE